MIKKPGKKTAKAAPETLDLSPEAKKAMEKLQKRSGPVSDEEANSAFDTVHKFIQGKLSWGELFNFNPQEMHDIAQIGYGFFKDSHYDKAEQIFKSLAVMEPENYYYRQMLGAIFQKRNQFEDAEAHYNDALSRNPDDVVSYTNRGEVYLRMGRFDQATADFDEAIKRDPGEKNKWAARARQLKYNVEHREELTKQAETHKGKK